MTPTAKAAYRRGIRDGLPFLLVLAPVGMLFGVVALDAGLTVGQAMGMTVLVIAGAAQFTAVQMLAENAGLWVIVAAALAVNLRMAMYSAALVPHLGQAPLWKRALVAYMNFDQTYATAVSAYDRHPDWGVEEKTAFFFGVATPLVPLWFATSLIGALIGKAIPDDWGIDFMMPLMFISMVGPMLRTPPQYIAAGVSVIVALLLSGLPSGFGLLIAAVIAMLTGALVEMQMERGRK